MLGEQQAAFVEQATIQAGMARWINHVHAAAEYRDATPASIQRRPLGHAIDTQRHAADDAESGTHEFAGEEGRIVAAFTGRTPRADHGQARQIESPQVALGP